jgi:hypothetical protein
VPEMESDEDEDEDEKAKEEALTLRKRLIRKRLMIRRGKQRASTKEVASEELSDGEVVDEVDEERPAKKGKKGGTTSAPTAKGSKSHNCVRSSRPWLMALYFHLAYAIFSSSSGLR